jgi:glutathione S-transferase
MDSRFHAGIAWNTDETQQSHKKIIEAFQRFTACFFDSRIQKQYKSRNTFSTMSFVALQVPSNYGYVLLSCLVGPFVSWSMMSGNVMKAREECDVQYPNLYATPAVHKQCDKFNRVQRGQQAMLETAFFFIPMALVGGLKHPIACTVHGVLYCVGSYLYQTGYMDMNLDVKKARHLKGGPIRYIGILGVIGAVISLTGTINGWW